MFTYHLFIINLFISIRRGKKASENHWHATTLEWAATSSPPLAHGNFTIAPEVYRGPYEYSVAGEQKDYTPQNELAKA